MYTHFFGPRCTEMASSALVSLAIFALSLQSAYGHLAYDDVRENQIQLYAAEDSCHVFKDEINVFHGVLSEGGILVGKIASNLTTTWIASWECPQINVFKALPCFIKVFNDYKITFADYRPQITDYNKKLFSEIRKVYVTLKQCVDSFHK